MCGIIGVSYGDSGAEGVEWTPSELAQIMFPAIVHRGPHAWGWMSWDGKGQPIEIQKHLGRADTPEAIEAMDVSAGAKWWVGHVRYATHGCPTCLANDHPIVHGNIVGVHNGVLRNHQSILAVTGREDPEAEVDSEAIFAAVNKYGHRAGLSKVQGDMVSVYADVRKPGTLNIARSYGRPLAYTYTANGSLIFASEARVIEETGVDHQGMKHLTSQYALLKVRRGRIKERIQYQSPTGTSSRDYDCYGQEKRRAAKVKPPYVRPEHKKPSELMGEDLERWMFNDIPGYRYDDEQENWIPCD